MKEKTNFDEIIKKEILEDILNWIIQNNPTDKILSEYVREKYSEYIYGKMVRPDSNYRLKETFKRYLKNKNINLRLSTKEEVVLNQIKSNIEKYGVKYKWQSEDIKKKAEESCLKRYGVTNYGMINKSHHNEETRKMFEKEFVEVSKKVHDNKYSYDKVHYVNARTKVIITCPIHGDFETLPDSHKNKGTGCLKCSGKYKKNKDEFIENARNIHKQKYNYDKVNYINNRTKVIITCPIHGDFEQIPANHINLGYGCPKCGFYYSRGEEKIERYLQENNINFVSQKRFDDCRNTKTLPFDFYLPEYNICIEYDGTMHYRPIKFLKEEMSHKKFRKQQVNDSIKNNYCKDSNIKLIRIPYWDFDKIEEILTNALNFK